MIGKFLDYIRTRPSVKALGWFQPVPQLWTVNDGLPSEGVYEARSADEARQLAEAEGFSVRTVKPWRGSVSSVRLPVADFEDDEPQGLDAVIGGGERDGQTIYRDGHWTDSILPRQR